jgi:hypothetical protein
VTAWAEYCRHVPRDIELADPTGGIGLTAAGLTGLAYLEVGPPVLSRALVALTYEFDRVLDVTAELVTLRNAGFRDDDLTDDDFGQCPDLAEWATSQLFEAIVAPSAAWPHPGGTICAVLEPGRGRLIRNEVIVPSGRPTVAVAAGTTYRRGERPTWL